MPTSQRGTEDSAPAVMDYQFPSEDLVLSGHLAEPTEGPHDAPGLLLCHGFPVRGRESPQSGVSFPELADRIAVELGWVVLAMNFRECGTAEGNYSIPGWLEDVGAGATELIRLGVTGVRVAGYGTDGSLAVCEWARKLSVMGVAARATPTYFDDWQRNPRRLLLHAREVQVIKDPEFPSSFDSWANGFKMVKPVEAASRLAPRPLLVVHGDSDDLTPLEDGRSLARAHGDAEFRLINGAGHELRHDPRAVAVLLGWLSRQQIAVLAQPTDAEIEIAQAAAEDEAVNDRVMAEHSEEARPEPSGDASARTDPEN